MAALNEAVAAVDLATETPTIDLSDAVVEGIARNIRSDGFAVVDGALGADLLELAQPARGYGPPSQEARQAEP